jgi:DNA-binding NtrC family response regulator
MISEIRAVEPDVKVIYITAWAMDDSIDHKLNMELKEFPKYRVIQKPFDLKTLWSTVKETLET